MQSYQFAVAVLKKEKSKSCDTGQSRNKVLKFKSKSSNFDILIIRNRWKCFNIVHLLTALLSLILFKILLVLVVC